MRVVFLCAGLALFAYLAFYLGVGQILQSLTALGWGYPVVVALFMAHQLVRAAALSLCLDREMPFRSLVSIRLSGEAIQSLTFSGPFLSEPSKAWLLARRGVALHEAFAGLLGEYLINAFLTAVITIVGLTWLRTRFPLPSALSAAALAGVIVMTAFLGAALVAIALRIYLLGAIVSAIGRAPLIGRHLKIDANAMRAMEDRLFLVLRGRPTRFLEVSVLEAAAHALLVTEVWWILTTLYEHVSLMHSMIVEAATKIAGITFFFVPGQIGTTEGIYAVVFRALGLASAGGFAVAFVRRVRTLVVSGIGLVVLSIVSRGSTAARSQGDAEGQPY